MLISENGLAGSGQNPYGSLCLEMFVSMDVNVLLDLLEVLAFFFEEGWKIGRRDVVEELHVTEALTNGGKVLVPVDTTLDCLE